MEKHQCSLVEPGALEEARNGTLVETLTAFLVVAFVVIITPGPDAALTIRNTLLGGRRAGVYTAIGVAAGQVVWTLATSAGIAALLTASEQVFSAVRLAGAAYLIFLGAQALQVALGARRDEKQLVNVSPQVQRLETRVALRHELVSNLTNPKMAAFFPALLPQFVPARDGTLFVLFLLGLLFSSMTLVWLTGYAFATAKARNLLRRSRIHCLLETATGAVLIALGLRLVTQRR